MTVPRPPLEIMQSIIQDLRNNDQEAVGVHLDDLQESLVERIMAGDLGEQSKVHAALEDALIKDKGLVGTALVVLLRRISISNKAATYIIGRSEEKSINQAVCENLIKGYSAQFENDFTDFSVALYWLNSGDEEIFKRFSDFIIHQEIYNEPLYREIVGAISQIRGVVKDDYVGTLMEWARNNEERIISLNPENSKKIENIAFHQILNLHRYGLKILPIALAQSSQMSPHYDDLINLREVLNFRFSEDRMQQEWSGNGTWGWSPNSSYIGLMKYHMIYRDSVAPSGLAADSIREAGTALIMAAQQLLDQGKQLIPERAGTLARLVVETAKSLEWDIDCAHEITAQLRESEISDLIKNDPRVSEFFINEDLGL